MKMLLLMLDCLLACVERLFPLMPFVPKSERGEHWLDAKSYYFIEDPSYRLWQRVKSVLCLNRNAVSFWRRRRMTMLHGPPCDHCGVFTPCDCWKRPTVELFYSPLEVCDAKSE